jgi:hypothetical protein
MEQLRADLDATNGPRRVVKGVELLPVSDVPPTAAER